MHTVEFVTCDVTAPEHTYTSIMCYVTGGFRRLWSLEHSDEYSGGALLVLPSS